MLKLIALVDGGSADLSLQLTYDQRQKSRLRIRQHNVEFGLLLPHGTVLQDGQHVRCEDGRIVVIRAAPEILSDVLCPDALVLARVCYHLGNRHVALEIRSDRVRYQADHVLDAMIRQMGLGVSTVTTAFGPESGAFRHAH